MAESMSLESTTLLSPDSLTAGVTFACFHHVRAQESYTPPPTFSKVLIGESGLVWSVVWSGLVWSGRVVCKWCAELSMSFFSIVASCPLYDLTC